MFFFDLYLLGWFCLIYVLKSSFTSRSSFARSWFAPTSLIRQFIDDCNASCIVILRGSIFWWTHWRTQRIHLFFLTFLDPFGDIFCDNVRPQPQRQRQRQNHSETEDETIIAANQQGPQRQSQNGVASNKHGTYCSLKAKASKRVCRRKQILINRARALLGHWRGGAMAPWCCRFFLRVVPESTRGLKQLWRRSSSCSGRKNCIICSIGRGRAYARVYVLPSASATIEGGSDRPTHARVISDRNI